MSTAAYERFVQVNGLQAEIERLAQTIFLTRLATAESAARAIRKLFEQGALPEEISDTVLTAYQHLGGTTVAIRSTATAEDMPGISFAGQQETFLINGALQAGIPTSFVDTVWGTSGRGQRSSDDIFHIFRLLRRLPSFVYWIVQQTRKQNISPKQKRQKVPRLNGEKLYAQIDRWVETFQRQDMSQLDDRELWNRWIPLWFERVKVHKLAPTILPCYNAPVHFHFLGLVREEENGRSVFHYCWEGASPCSLHVSS